MKVLLSIRPEFVDKIFAGTKKFEFRKSLFKKSGIKYVVIYASAPIKRVVGEFEIEDILSDEIDVIWERTQKYAGITESFYKSYFQNRKTANAIKIGRIKNLRKQSLCQIIISSKLHNHFAILNNYLINKKRQNCDTRQRI